MREEATPALPSSAARAGPAAVARVAAAAAAAARLCLFCWRGLFVVEGFWFGGGGRGERAREILQG